MAGADVAVTDAAIADLVVEYAMHLARAATTDIVTVPVPDEGGGGGEVVLLLGPSSQIVISGSAELGADELPRVGEVTADLQTRIERLTGPLPAASDDEDVDPREMFVDFDVLRDQS